MSVAEPEDGKIAVALTDALRRCGGPLPDNLIITKPERQRKQRIVPELLICSNKLKKGGGRSRILRCGTLLSGAESSLAVEAVNRVSYGMSDNDWLTLSSIGERDCLMAVLREFKTLKGDTVDRQEICIKRRYGLSPYESMAAAGAMLLLGIQPGNIV